MSDFETDVQKWCNEAAEKADLFMKAFALRMTAEVKMNTPVLTGRLRSSIQPMTNLASWQMGEPVLIGTNVEYARRIEYGFVGRDSLGRNYHQEGAHMFARALAKADQIADEVLHDIQGGGDGSGGAPAPESGGGAGGAAEHVAEGAAIGAGAVVIGAVVGGPVGAAIGAGIDLAAGGVEAVAIGLGAEAGLGGAAEAITTKILGEEAADTILGSTVSGGITGGAAGGAETFVPEDEKGHE